MHSVKIFKFLVLAPKNLQCFCSQQKLKVYQNCLSQKQFLNDYFDFKSKFKLSTV